MGGALSEHVAGNVEGRRYFAGVSAKVSGQFECALLAGDAGAEQRLLSRLGVKVKPELDRSRAHVFYSRRLDEEMLQGATGGSVLRRMDGVGAPFDEEGQYAGIVFFQAEGLPTQGFAVRPGPRAITGVVNGDSAGSGLLRYRGKIARVCRPANQARLLDRA